MTGRGWCSRPASARSPPLLGRAAGDGGVADLAVRAPAAGPVPRGAGRIVQAFGFGRAVFRYAERLAGHDAALALLAARRVRVYEALARLAPTGVADYGSGDLIARLVADVDSLADRWLRVRLPYAAAAVAGTGAVALVTAMQPEAGLILAATLVVSALAAPAAAIALSRREERDLAPLRGDLAAATLALLDGAAELIAFGAADRALAAVQDKGAQVGRARPVRDTGGAQRRRSACSDRGGVRRGVLRRARRPDGRPGRGAARGRRAHAAGRARGVRRARAGRAEVPRLRASADRVTEVLARPAPVTEPPAPRPLPGPPYRLAAHGLTVGWAPGSRCSMTSGSTYRPGPGSPSSGRPDRERRPRHGAAALPRLRERPGRRLRRLGGEGAGTVTLNGIDIRSFAADDLRRTVGLCEQDAHVFDSTLEANLRLAKPDATDRELRAALARARLLAWTDSLPQGLRTPVGEHGARLSGGQRQRLALARVLLADFPVVILDEPAEHLDEETADELTRDLLGAVAGRTVLLITHRPVDPATVDQVLRLADGRVMPAHPVALQGQDSRS